MSIVKYVYLLKPRIIVQQVNYENMSYYEVHTIPHIDYTDKKIHYILQVTPPLPLNFINASKYSVLF